MNNELLNKKIEIIDFILKNKDNIQCIDWDIPKFNSRTIYYKLNIKRKYWFSRNIYIVYKQDENKENNELYIDNILYAWIIKNTTYNTLDDLCSELCIILKDIFNKYQENKKLIKKQKIEKEESDIILNSLKKIK